jgi:3-methyladenine DNA glycosylase AlkD
MTTAGGTGREAAELVAALRRMGSRRNREGMARYAIPSDRAFGVPMGKIQALARRVGKSHALAEALWKTGWHEARLLAVYVGDPQKLTPAQMDRWCRDFDNWAICDTVCFQLFDKTPHAFPKVREWAGRHEEFVRRGAFALLASLALHDRQTRDDRFVRCLSLAERAAADERNFVKKGVSWALRSVGRRSRGLHTKCLALARRLAASEDRTRRWIGKDALRDLMRPAVTRKWSARD